MSSATNGNILVAVFVAAFVRVDRLSLSLVLCDTTRPSLERTSDVRTLLCMTSSLFLTSFTLRG